jgi:hypothetical protein
MEFKLVAPDLRRLDQATSEVLAVCLSLGERPPRGAAGLIDWRLGGRLSQLIQSGFLQGELDETALLPGQPKLPFEKVLLFGTGAQAEFDEGVFRRIVSKMMEVFEGLRARTAVVDLPGRRFEAIAAERSLALVLELSQSWPSQHSWTLVEPLEAHKPLLDHMLRERRRAK